jgi:hypothetical protein
MIPPLVEQILLSIGAESGDAEAPLDLTSLQVVTLVERLEQEYGVCFDGKDVTRAFFGTRSGIVRLLMKKKLL